MADLKCDSAFLRSRAGEWDPSLLVELAASFRQVILFECPWIRTGLSRKNRAVMSYMQTSEVLRRRRTGSSDVAYVLVKTNVSSVLRGRPPSDFWFEP